MHPPRCDCFECLPGVSAQPTTVTQDKRVLFTRPMRNGEREKLYAHQRDWRDRNREAYLAMRKAGRQRAA